MIEVEIEQASHKPIWLKGGFFIRNNVIIFSDNALLLTSKENDVREREETGIEGTRTVLFGWV
jgi:hypothetical protein